MFTNAKFANIKHGIAVFNEHSSDVCEDSSKCEKDLCLEGYECFKKSVQEITFHLNARNHNK